jgi:hypothetical protein
MKTTRFFEATRSRPDRAGIRAERIQRMAVRSENEQVQSDGRIKRWSQLPEAGNSYLRVVFLDDGETIHSAFFDRGFKP